MRVLITRPEIDAKPLAQILRAMGHDSVIAPLLDIRFRDGAEIVLDGVQAILATSANGVRGIARRTLRRDVPVFAVGPQTEDAARTAGFKTVRNAQGDGDALVRATIEWAEPANGALLHAAGAEAPKSVASALNDAGFTVQREILYEAVAANELPPLASDALKNDTLDAMLLFSPRSAHVFRECVTRAGLASYTERLTAFCISPTTAEALAGLNFRDIRIAKRPDQGTLLALLPA